LVEIEKSILKSILNLKETPNSQNNFEKEEHNGRSHEATVSRRGKGRVVSDES